MWTKSEPSCQASYINDVWFTVTVPPSGNLTLQTGEATGSDVDDTIMAVYSGTCGALTEVDCNDDDDENGGLFSYIALTGRTPGEVLYVMVSQYDSFFSTTTPGQFRFAAFDADLLSAGTFDKNKFVAYPNPVKDVLHLSYAENMTDVAVYNMLGQKVLGASPASNDANLNMSSLSNGAYTVKVATANAVKTIKVMKQ
ncbi:MAG: T9SS type A sorting domain-containing protein [Sphingobacteriales bacterium]|nr:MAG: T9SS type A sorting domain-containing protein [Sphingobacteriales bacterium]